MSGEKDVNLDMSRPSRVKSKKSSLKKSKSSSSKRRTSHRIKCKILSPKELYITDTTKILGQGTFGVVYPTQHRESGEMYAIKKVDFKGISSEDKSLNLRETRFLAKLTKSPYILNLKECFYYKDRLYSIVDLAIGDLKEFMLSNEYTLHNEQLVFKLFEQMVYSIRDVHSKNIAHRDIKPANFLIKTYISGIPKLLLSDFGLSAFMKSGKLLDDFPGTPRYASPELITGIEYDGRLSDVWALGVCLYELYYGHPPFVDDDDHDELMYKIRYASPKFPGNVGISIHLENLIVECLRKLPSRRPSIKGIITSKWFRGQLSISEKLVENSPDF